MRATRISDFSEFISLRKDWNELAERFSHRSVFLTHEWFSTWWSSFGEGRTLSIYRVENEGRILGYAPLMRYGDTLSFMAGEDVSDYCDFLYDEGRAEVFFQALMDAVLGEKSIRKLDLINIKMVSPTIGALTGWAARKEVSCDVVPMEVTPVLELPASYEQFLRELNRKHRHEIRRKLRRAGGLPELQFKSTGRNTSDGDIEAFIDLHRRYGGPKLEFWKKQGMDIFFNTLFNELAARRWARLDSLFSGGNLAASILIFEYGRETSLYNMAYSREYSSYNPGYYLLNNAIESAIRKQQKSVNFLRGREKYKYEFGAEDYSIVSLTLNTGEISS